MTYVEPRPATVRRGDCHAVPHTDAAHRPGVAAPPSAARVRTAVTGAVVRRALDRLPLRARYADGTSVGRGGPLLEIRDPRAFHARIGTHGLIGFGESYMAA